jgi:GT2 family glycosyltransferase
MTAPPTDVLVVIVNYRTADLTLACLESLCDERLTLPGMRVIVVDGGSADDSAERLALEVKARDWSKWVRVLPVSINGGFAYANNRGIEPALKSPNPPRYVHLLNPDTVIHSGAVAQLVEFLDAHPEVGIAGSRLENPDGSPRSYAFRFPTVVSEFEGGLRLGIVSKLLRRWVSTIANPSRAQRVDWVSGASMMVRQEVFDRIGLLDDGYFLYFEEVDFIRRAARAGWTCWTVPESRVVHLAGQSTGLERGKAVRRRPGYWYASRSRYFVSNHGLGQKLLADLAWIAGYSMNLVRRALTFSLKDAPPLLLVDFVQNNARLLRDRR